MSYVQPNSTIRIFKNIPFDPNYENTVIFDNLGQQLSFFSNMTGITLNNQSYTRVNKGVIKVSPNTPLDDNAIADFYNSNYLAFKNTSFENKWFYAFIDKVEYVNNNCVTIMWHIDVIQTYMFDWTFEDCLIEREHTTDDIFGKYTLPEGLETGPYRSYIAECNLEDPNSPTGLSYMYNRFEYRPCIILACSLDIYNLSWGSEFDNTIPGVVVPGASDDSGNEGGCRYYSGIRYYPFLLTGETGGRQGIYEFNFGGTWAAGNVIYINSAQNAITLTTQQAQNSNTVAETVAAWIAANLSTYYSCVNVDFGVIRVLEKPGYYGWYADSGYPQIVTFAENATVYKYTVQEGSSDYEYGDINRLNEILVDIANHNRKDTIAGLFIMPYEFYPTAVTGAKALKMRVTAPTTVDTYTPRNKKLLCYPYNMLNVTNNCGNDAEYKFENFLNLVQTNPETYALFRIWGNLSMNPGMYCAPHRYNGSIWAQGAIEDELVVTGFPMCSYNIDSFNAWLAQNTGTIVAAGLGLIGSWATALSSTATGLKMGGLMAEGPLADTAGINPEGYLGQHSMYTPKEGALVNKYMSGQGGPSQGLIGATLGALGQLYDHARTAPQTRGNSNANVIYQGGQLTFNWYYKQIRAEYAKIIDNYFDMYGYKTNRVGTPNLKARPCYSYVKTIGCCVHGAIPGDFKQLIDSIFDKGIRFWRVGATYGSYDPTVNDNRV